VRQFVAIVVAALLALAFSAPARAEVWGYVDEKGVSHFASEKVDHRYELFFRGGQSFDTAAGAGARSPRSLSVPSAASSKLIAFFEISPGYKQVQHHLRAASRQHDVDYELLKALIATESGFNASAVSPKGAVGLMQIMPATAQRYGVSSDNKQQAEKKLSDPAVNIRTGTRYLRYLIDMFPGQLELALAAYNAGEGAVMRAGNRIPNFKETQNYVKTVMQLYAMLKPPASLDKDRGGRSGGRVRMELVPRGSTFTDPRENIVGGAIGRGKLPLREAARDEGVPVAAAAGGAVTRHELSN
jgi:soluble lytic murein transglycosylase-like protein